MLDEVDLLVGLLDEVTVHLDLAVDLHELGDDSAGALSKALPVLPGDRAVPRRRQALARALAVYWPDSIGRRNTSMMEVFVVATMRERQREVQLYRGQVGKLTLGQLSGNPAIRVTKKILDATGTLTSLVNDVVTIKKYLPV